MIDDSRIEDLRRRVHEDPASIAFAQLAEEYRRAGSLQEAVDICQAGLTHNPDYLSARLTLGRALGQLGTLEDARVQLQRVLDAAPGNLGALRALADVHYRTGAFETALAHSQTAFALAPNDPDLETVVRELSRKVAEQAEFARRTRAGTLLAALDQWLAAIHVTRAQRSA